MEMETLSSYRYGAINQEVDIPICNVLTVSLDCFSLKECLTDQESKFLGNLIVTLYKMIMVELDRAMKMFPGNKLSEYLAKNNVGTNEAKLGVNMIKGMVQDFKTNGCQTSLKAWKDCTSDCSYSDEKYFSIGCWKDDLPRAIPILEGNAVLDMHYKTQFSLFVIHIIFIMLRKQFNLTLTILSCVNDELLKLNLHIF